jgi:hypothetical protein
VKSIATQRAKLDGIRNVESVFTVDWKELTEWQQQAILEKLSQQSGKTEEAILKDISKVGFPIRRAHVVSCGTNRMELFL